MFIIEVLKALMRRLLIAGRRMIKALPDEIRDRNKGLLITTEGQEQSQAPAHHSPELPQRCLPVLRGSSLPPITNDLCEVGYTGPRARPRGSGASFPLCGNFRLLLQHLQIASLGMT